MMYTAHDGKTFGSYEALCEYEMLCGPNKEHWKSEYNKCKARDARILNAFGGQENASIIGKIILYGIVFFSFICLVYCIIAGL